MERRKLEQSFDLYRECGFWRLRRRKETDDAAGGFIEGDFRKPVWIGPATGPERLTKKQAQEIAWENFLSRLDRAEPVQESALTIADFVEQKFVPEHVATKKLSGRTHYHAILKHVLTPEEVDRVFHVEAGKSKTKLKTVPNWPYLGNVRLRDARPDHVQQLVSAALNHGYSTQTVKHIRNVVGAIFAHAKRENCFAGDNPASRVTLPGMTRKEAHALTLAQAEEVLGAMRYPEKEMTLMAILTNLNVAEICGLQWKSVNLTEVWSKADGEPLPPRSIAIRKQWSRGKLNNVEVKRRHRDVSIPGPLLPILRGLSQRTRFTGADDFVFVSRNGTPIKESNIATRRLKPIGKALRMPWLSWQVLRRTRTALAYEHGRQLLHDIAMREDADPGAITPAAKFAAV